MRQQRRVPSTVCESVEVAQLPSSLSLVLTFRNIWQRIKGKNSPYSITERRVPELILVLGSQHAGDVSHKLDGRLPLLSAKLQLHSQPFRGLLHAVSLLGEQRYDGCEQFA